MKKSEIKLYKESALINCENKFTILQRNIINALLFIAKKQYRNKFNKNKKENKFFISNNELKSLISTSEVNITSVFNLIEIIKNTWFKANIDNKDKFGVWPENFSFIQGYTIEKDGIYFELSNAMFTILTVSNKSQIPFSILDLEITKKFKSRYSLILYEFISDYINAPSLPLINIKKLKSRLGIQDRYSEFNDIIKKIKKAIIEIKNITGIDLSPSVSRKGQTPVAIKFKINKKWEITNNNDDLSEKSITLRNKNTVLVTENHKENQISEQNKELIENNMTAGKVNSVHLEPEKEQIPAERVKEILSRIDFFRLPAEKQKELKERYQI